MADVKAAKVSDRSSEAMMHVALEVVREEEEEEQAPTAAQSYFVRWPILAQHYEVERF
ncbi:uncharacterized protein AKAW2_70261A [Aspergillus luchuensis]|uniref:MFS transporter n=1 Tax=Aspergillus kawachii TaxID=1069201 RepID=A0A146FFX3_ASPKA|nr:uncharacterized protein AKAW2_70261A [Aspergillus luchuensis]BCS03383.1 hypothetical protein AKAW2_70261A [Aspergillus luchuensis]BCS15011.1 hypothetical protein ALUC_70244A [Aspergillus luchuensis]GAT24479.1 MFS transporter [Aspergillus luchuensis]